MPRPNQPRSIASEENLARRITYERERAGMSYAGLAQRMTERGCPIDQSALFKIEKGSPRRRITVDELVALAAVFKVSPDKLLIPLGLLFDKRAAELARHYESASRVAADAQDEANRAWSAVRQHLAAHPDRQSALLTELAGLLGIDLDETDTVVFATAAPDGGAITAHVDQGRLVPERAEDGPNV